MSSLNSTKVTATTPKSWWLRWLPPKVKVRAAWPAPAIGSGNSPGDCMTRYPDFYLSRARRQLSPWNTVPDYVDAYRTLAELCPKAAHWALDKAARMLAEGPPGN